MQTGAQQKRSRYTLRAVRPLFYWAGLVFVLSLAHTHERLSERTRLNFNVFLELMRVSDEATVQVDGRPVTSGDRIPIGWHTVAFSHPKAVPFSTNLFIWYGPNYLGRIDLKRAQGVLDISAMPAPLVLSITGPEWDVTKTNSAAVIQTVPTDDYAVTARYRYFEAAERLHVFASTTNQLKIAPRFGTLQLTCNQSNASFKLLPANGAFVEANDFPAVINEVPEGTYQLNAQHGDHHRIESVRMKAGLTNLVSVEFRYGVAVVETTPAGASVTTADGRERGQTPLTLTQLEPGRLNLQLRMENYESITVPIYVTVDATNIVHTNLVSLSYTRAMRSAREAMASGDYDRANKSLINALRAVPNDLAAIELQHAALGAGSIARAKELGSRGDYIAGSKELEKALVELPESTEVKELLSEFRKQRLTQAARQRDEHIEALKKTLDSFTGKITGAAFVEVHELKASKQVKEVQSAIADQFRSVAPTFKLTHVWTNEASFCMDVDQEIAGGGRLGMIVGGQITDDETRVLFKVVEYKGEALGLKILGAVIGAATSTKFQSGFQPINPCNPQLSDTDKNRLAEGVRIVTERIQHALQ